MAKYRNVTDRDLSVPGVGIVKAGMAREMPDGFHNVNFKREEPASKKAETPKNDKDV